MRSDYWIQQHAACLIIYAGMSLYSLWNCFYFYCWIIHIISLINVDEKKLNKYRFSEKSGLKCNISNVLKRLKRQLQFSLETCHNWCLIAKFFCSYCYLRYSSNFLRRQLLPPPVEQPSICSAWYLLIVLLDYIFELLLLSLELVLKFQSQSSCHIIPGNVSIILSSCQCTIGSQMSFISGNNFWPKFLVQLCVTL